MSSSGGSPAELDRTARERDALAELVETVARLRDRAAFARLFEHFAPRIKGYLMRSGTDAGQAEELAQEAMLAVWNRAETFDRRQSSASTWIFTIARNKRIDGLRRKRPELDPSDPLLVPAAPQQADEILATAQSEVRLRAAIAGLPPEQKELLELAFYQDKSHRDIASERGIPLGTVKSRLRLALVRLRKVVEEG